MRYAFQFGVLCVIYYIGELIVSLGNLPVPGSMIGLILLFLLLRLGIIRREQIQDTALFMIQIFPVMFIPITTGLMVSYGLLSGHIWAFLLITLMSTVVVFLSTGWTAQGIIRHQNRRKDRPEDQEESGRAASK